jgi:chromosome segregation ATPase
MAGLPEDRLLEKLQTSIDQWNGEVTSAHDTLTRQIRDTRSQLQTLIEVLARRKGITVPAQHALPAPEIAARLEALEDDIAQLREERDRALARINELAAERDLARKEAERLRMRAPESPGVAEAARAEIEALQTALDEKNRRLREQQARQADLQAALDSAAAQRDEIKPQLDVAHQEIDSLNFALAHLQETLGTLNTARKREQEEAERRIAELQNQLAANQDGSLHANGRELAAARDEIAALQQRVRDLESASDIEAEVVEAIALDAHAAADDADLDDRAAALAEREQVLAHREEKLRRAAERMQHLEETALRFQEQITQLEAARQTEAVPADAARAVAELEARDDTIHDLQKHMQLLERRLMQAEKQNEYLPKQLDNALRELDRVRNTVAEKDAEIELLRSRLAPGDSPAARAEAERIAKAAVGSDGARRSIGAILMDAGIITKNQLDSALDEQKVSKKRRLGSILVEKGLVREEIVAQVVAHQLSLPFVHIPSERIEPAAVSLLNGRLATHHMCFPLRATSSEITVAMANPLDLIAIEDLEIATSLKVRPAVATLADISTAIVRHYGVNITPTLEDRFDTPYQPRKTEAETAE